MKGPAGVGGDPVGVRTRRRSRRHAYRGLFTIQAGAIQIALGRVVRRRDVVDPLTGLVHRRNVDDVEVAGRDVRDALPVPANPVDVPPAVALARPEKLGALRKPLDLVHDVDPGTVALGEDGSSRSCRRIREHDAVGVLEPVDTLEDQLVRSRPFHAREIVLARVIGDLQPRRGAAVGTYDSCPHRRIPGPDLGILNGSDVGIERVGVVDEEIRAQARHVESPVGDLRAVG